MSDRKVAYAQGYLDGLKDGGWQCFDCGNTYEADVDACPNKKVDQAQAHLRYEQKRAE